jgi:hypothetical protein
MVFSVFRGLNHPHLPAQFPYTTSRSTRHTSHITTPTNCTTAHTTGESYTSLEDQSRFSMNFGVFRSGRKMGLNCATVLSGILTLYPVPNRLSSW